jgi:hypothetical protein
VTVYGESNLKYVTSCTEYIEKRDCSCIKYTKKRDCLWRRYADMRIVHVDNILKSVTSHV